MGKRCCILVKWLYLGKSESFWEKVVLFGKKNFVFGESCCNRLKVVVIGQKLFYSVKSGSILEKLCIWVKLLCSGESGCNQAKVLVFGKKWLYSG